MLCQRVCMQLSMQGYSGTGLEFFYSFLYCISARIAVVVVQLQYTTFLHMCILDVGTFSQNCLQNLATKVRYSHKRVNEV